MISLTLDVNKLVISANSNEKNAVIHSSTEIIKHISEMLENEVVTTISGIKVPIKADTFCVHSDTENATEIVKSIHKFYI